ncbi:Eco57I restriction-modification methylase domain-containing protein [Bradyrhizobium tunisiense]|uniref:Eco57I restriction-modification methylase domain-containing protein n=1 Tax=Bradyrhizobium tunisiense TaxID=3278709 RepID=UPI0035E26A12
MASLDRTLRKDLEATVKKARRVAEAGADKAVAQLGVGETEAPKHLSAEQRALRNRLRAHSRLLGDQRDTRTGAQDTTRLAQECAYEHWHRMLFARFLAETDLLIEPDSGVAITLEEVQELAREKATDWLELASDYAERMLPQIFGKDDPVLQIVLPPETRSELEDLLKGLTNEVFEADDSLGWVYQYWQTDKKDEVNKSEVKIGADELPAVTQLFTEDYMVLFLLHNTLGAWWAGRVLAANPLLACSAKTEDELRAACRVGDVNWTYLRFVRDKAEDGVEGTWRPAAGVFDDWPKLAKGITVLDPCMGSGHFLVFALPILAAFRMQEESLSQPSAIDAVLRDNLFGLEIDPRCTQIAAFNLAFAAWRRVGYRPLPQLNVACSGLAIGVTKAEWLKLAEKAVTAADPAAKRDLLGVEENLLTVGLEERVKNGLDALYDLFAKAPWLGSLIDPRRASSDIFREGFEKLEPTLASILAAADTDDAREMAVAAKGMAKAAELLALQFTLVTTNVPYLGRGKQDDVVKSYCDVFYPRSRADLAFCMLQRCVELSKPGGVVSVVTPQSWLFLNSYKGLRQHLLKTIRWPLIAKLGSNAFQDMNWWAAITLLGVFENRRGDDASVVHGIDVGHEKDQATKALLLQRDNLLHVRQSSQAGNPASAIIFDDLSGRVLLSAYAASFVGFQNGDSPRWIANFWEVPAVSGDWSFFQMTTERTASFDGRTSILRWENGQGDLAKSDQAFVKGTEAWGKRGVIVRHMRDLPCSVYCGDMYDQSSAVIIPHEPRNLPAIWAFCSNPRFNEEVRKIDQSVKVTNATLVKVPFDLDYWTAVAAKDYPSGLPSPTSSVPTQWLFDGLPAGATAPLHVATARLLAYQWPRQTTSSFMDCPALGADGLERYADVDGIVCLVATKGEPPAAERLNALLAASFGRQWSAAKLASLLGEVGYVGKSLDDWLRDGFFAQHCDLFDQRPFVWHIWDGRRDGFHALVNYHRLAAPNGEGRRTLEKLIYSYLGDWIDRQRAEQNAGVEGADARLAHSEHLKAELIKILEGERPYDIFVRWKPLHQQSIGWDPDINDGVRMNIRPFMNARTLNARGTNTCVLRSTPKIKWDKDRGKEPTRDKDDYPWFWGWDESSADFVGAVEFDGNRWNNLHYSRAAKQSARHRHRVSIGGKA